MEICARTGCSHVQALHEGRTGHCRLNGCRCDEFRAPAPEPVPTVAVTTQAMTGPTVSVEAFTAIVTVIAFAAGVVLGINL